MYMHLSIRGAYLQMWHISEDTEQHAQNHKRLVVIDMIRSLCQLCLKLDQNLALSVNFHASLLSFLEL